MTLEKLSRLEKNLNLKVKELEEVGYIYQSTMHACMHGLSIIAWGIDITSKN